MKLKIVTIILFCFFQTNQSFSFELKIPKDLRIIGDAVKELSKIKGKNTKELKIYKGKKINNCTANNNYIYYSDVRDDKYFNLIKGEATLENLSYYEKFTNYSFIVKKLNTDYEVEYIVTPEGKDSYGIFGNFTATNLKTCESNQHQFTSEYERYDFILEKASAYFQIQRTESGSTGTWWQFNGMTCKNEQNPQCMKRLSEVNLIGYRDLKNNLTYEHHVNIIKNRKIAEEKRIAEEKIIEEERKKEIHSGYFFDSIINKTLDLKSSRYKVVEIENDKPCGWLIKKYNFYKDNTFDALRVHEKCNMPYPENEPEKITKSLSGTWEFFIEKNKVIIETISETENSCIYIDFEASVQLIKEGKLCDPKPMVDPKTGKFPTSLGLKYNAFNISNFPDSTKTIGNYDKLVIINFTDIDHEEMLKINKIDEENIASLKEAEQEAEQNKCKEKDYASNNCSETSDLQETVAFLANGDLTDENALNFKPWNIKSCVLDMSPMNMMNKDWRHNIYDFNKVVMNTVKVYEQGGFTYLEGDCAGDCNWDPTGTHSKFIFQASVAKERVAKAFMHFTSNFCKGFKSKF